MDPDQPVKLASTDESGHLYLYKDIIDQCFLNPRYSDYPAYLLCVIGEKRKGKSFLMNYIMRALRSLEIGGEFTLGEEEEPLTGFEWESGTDSTTKGIWMWNRPFILTDEDQKIAVFVLDTEGSQDIGGNREACIKLSALSLFLGSRLIFNVSSSLKETELDYMEVRELQGTVDRSTVRLNLDLLVRDWHNSQCNDKQAQSYITREMEYIKKSNLYPLALWSLQDSETRCFLLPHPGKKITKKGKGRLKDMDEDFRESLGNYIHYVVNGVRETIWNDTCGTLLTCKQLPSMLEVGITILHCFNITTCNNFKMFYTIKNEKMKEEIEGEFREFLKNQSSMILPSTMRSEASKMCSSLLEAFRFLVHGNNVSSHNALLKELEKNLLEEQEKFCENYASSFKLKVAGVGLTAAGLGMYGIVGAAARAGASMAIQPAVAVGQRAVASEVMTGAVALLKTGATAMLSRFLR
ncbi:hypothetical protein GDO86_019810 [Hymenochirus boettgeri]|uniref:GB1/RHD3-type G domain-containing protein n=1 Tax=Hymenochirus boettgeri TaxID=247094 RepID=A0A8T2INY1_9PIPI|nr:hypothetical protein GDO86_019810 [Hymenochirus boettgeri]